VSATRHQSSTALVWELPYGRTRASAFAFQRPCDLGQSPTFFRARPDLRPIFAGRRRHDKRMAMWLAIVAAVGCGLPARLRRENGQTLAEYGIVISVIAVIVIAAALLLGSSISTLFSSSAPKV
jgi:Flp pilus assembly pilin Flp